MNWTTALQQTLAGRGDKIPNGWESGEAIGRVWKLGTAMRNERLKLMVDQGKAERRSFKMMKGGVLRTVPHYRLKG